MQRVRRLDPNGYEITTNEDEALPNGGIVRVPVMLMDGAALTERARRAFADHKDQLVREAVAVTARHLCIERMNDSWKWPAAAHPQGDARATFEDARAAYCHRISNAWRGAA